MNLMISRFPQTIVIIILALLTLLAMTFILLSTVAHIDVLHMILSWSTELPDFLSRRP